MKKTEQAEFLDFMLDEATKYGRAITKPEIETYFENFGRHTFGDFKRAWMEHKRDAKSGHFFPKIVDLQRILRTTGDGATSRDDSRCIWNANGDRCRYPVGFFAQGAHEGYCIFHRSNMSGLAAEAICHESQEHTAEQYVERAKKQTYGTSDNSNVAQLRAQLRKVEGGTKIGILATRLLQQREPGADEGESALTENELDALMDAERIRLANLEASFAEEQEPIR